MARFSLGVAVVLALLALNSCGSPVPPPTATLAPPSPAASAAAATPLAARDQLGKLVEHYWDEHIAPENVISPQLLADSLTIERRYLAELGAISRDKLDAQSALSFDMFKRQREILVEGFTFPAELLPINPFGGMPQQFATLAADTELHPLTTVADYEGWLRRIDAYEAWTQQAMANMRLGIRRGYTSPRALIERTIPILDRLGRDTAANVFYLPLRSMPDAIKDPDRTRLNTLLSAAIAEKLLPANRALHDFLLHEYLPRGRPGLALSDLALGDQWYAHRIRLATGSALSADEIHRIGLAEVERIRARLPATATAVPTTAAAAGVGVAGDLLSAYADLSAQVSAALPTVFAEAPQAALELRATQWLLPAQTGLYYRPSESNGRAPAILYINTDAAHLRAGKSTANFLQHGLPGQHLQMALQRERKDLPRFRRWGTEPAFVEGWGLYAASLGEELSVYPDDAAKSEAWMGQLRCAVDLVVDTGLHAKAWPRSQALDYLHAQLSIDDATAQSLVDSYAANPGDALACTIGELKFQALRGKAQQVLGGRFDLSAFHSEILREGAIPLDLLDARMKVWMDAPR